ncbi:MAG: amidase [Methylocystaceae bacterium]|nr:amidase [Methylocystaceae bacterium]
MDLCFLSVEELNQLYKSKTLSPVDVCKAVLDKIRSENPTYNAMCFVDEEQAIKDAKLSEKRWRNGKPLSQIDGVPTTIKDLVLTKGWPTLRGSLTVKQRDQWNEDAPCVDKLRKSGAVLIGKTTTPEFGSKGVTESRLNGITRNACNPERTSGGSSGGAAVAAARGFGVLHIGSDGAGSIRIPSSFNGIFGLKPTFGRVPAYPASPLGTFSHIGPMTRCVRDAAYMMNIISQPDPRDWYALPFDNVDYCKNLDNGLKNLRIGYSKDLGYASVDDQVANSFQLALNKLTDQGVHLEEIASPLAEDPSWITDKLWFYAYLNITTDMTETDISEMDFLQQEMLEKARTYNPKDILEAEMERVKVATKLVSLHTQYDLILTPTMPITAFTAGQFNPWGTEKPEDWIRWSSFTYPFNQSQQPAATIPCGVDTQGMPIGIQVIGNKYDDALVLRAASFLEKL